MLKKSLLIFLLFFVFSSAFSQSFQNPILAGYYPDPSICRRGDDYYIVNSSFAYYPGIPVFHSKDLLNWQLIGYAMNRPEQLNLDGAHVSRGLFAPAISYHNGTFYLVCTDVSKLGNFVITTKNPAGPWSNPVSLPQVNGIDPSLFFDENNKAYIVFNSIPPNNKPLYDGHRTIRMFAFDADKLQVIGEEKVLINGGTDLSKKPVWIEGPHLIKKNGWYYLICAEGGTGNNHSEVVFRSRSVEGPFVSYEKNPILTQRQLVTNRKNPITSTGHADIVEAKDGKWWGVFLGCRPYEADYYNTGRETFMAPVKWEAEWPAFDLGGEEVKYTYPIHAVADPKREGLNGNYFFHDDFASAHLNLRYRFLRTLRKPWYIIAKKSGTLRIALRPETCAGTGNPSFIGFHQPHLKGYAATSLTFTPRTENEQAGLLVFQNEKAYYYLCKTLLDNQPVVNLYKGEKLLSTIQLDRKNNQAIFFKAEAKGNEYAFYYATKKDNWIVITDHADAKYLSTKSAGGFVGCLYAMYVSSNGQASGNTAVYHWFEVKNEDDVYK